MWHYGAFVCFRKPMQYATVPNLLSLSRLLLAFVMFWSIYQSWWYVAVTVLWLAIATDVSDGYLARKMNLTSSLGGLFDHGSDAFFVTFALAAHVSHGWVPVVLVILVPLAFTQYMLDSKALSGHSLRSSMLGRYNGIAYYVLAGFPIMQITLGLTVIPFEFFIWISWGLVITTVISMTDRLVTLLSNTSPGKPTDNTSPDN